MDHPQFDAGNKPFEPTQNPEGFGPEGYVADGFTPGVPPAKRRGCFFYGCLIASILAVIGLILAAVIAYVGWNFYIGKLNEYTGTAPIPIPKVEVSEDAKKTLDERVAAFKKALDEEEAAEIVLSADDINALLSENETFKDRIYVSIDNDKISAKVSIPLEQTGLPGTAGRYFNGNATAKIELKDGNLIVYIQELEANGKTLPPEVKTQLAGENIAKNFTNNPDTSKQIARFKSIEVEDGKVIIKSKGKKPDSAETKPATREPKPDPKAEEAPKVEPPKGEEAPKPEEAPKVEPPKGEEAPKAEPPKTEEAPKVETAPKSAV